jgi:hypothetical protein
MVAENDLSVRLTGDELEMLLDGLDALEYWQLGDVLPRNNGEVFIPGDMPPAEDRYWGSNPVPTPDEVDAIDRVRRCRALADRLRSVEPHRPIVRGEDERPRCSLCGEPIELADPLDPEGWIHSDDANDRGDHTAES